MRVDEDEVVPDDGDAEDEGVDAVEDAAMAGEEATGILHASGAFAGGFEEVAHLSGDVAEHGHYEQPPRERVDKPRGSARPDKEARLKRPGD